MDLQGFQDPLDLLALVENLELLVQPDLEVREESRELQATEDLQDPLDLVGQLVSQDHVERPDLQDHQVCIAESREHLYNSRVQFIPLYMRD